MVQGKLPEIPIANLMQVLQHGLEKYVISKVKIGRVYKLYVLCQQNLHYPVCPFPIFVAILMKKRERSDAQVIVAMPETNFRNWVVCQQYVF